MAILGKLFGSQGETYKDVRKALYGDLPPDQWPTDLPPDTYPWTAFVAARKHLAAGDRGAAIASWREITNHPDLEPRHYLQAWHFLRQQGQLPPSDVGKRLLSVIIEVGLPQGSDLLAVYSDHSARYYNYSGASVVWDHPDASLDSGINQLLEVSGDLLAQLGHPDQAQPAPPPLGHARLNLLTPSGVHSAEGAIPTLARDPLAGRVLQAAAALMKDLIVKAEPGVSGVQ